MSLTRKVINKSDELMKEAYAEENLFKGMGKALLAGSLEGAANGILIGTLISAGINVTVKVVKAII